MSNNNPPFAIGQRVVCLTTPFDSGYIIGKEYTVSVNVYCPVCGKWQTGCFGAEDPDGQYFGCCGKKQPPCGYRVIYSTRFTPVQNLYEDIREELAKQVVIGDSADQPIREVVNN